MTSLIGYLDMNAYFAAVEQQTNPALRGKPIVVGGRPGTRSVVTTASYEARALGVQTAMAMHEAIARYPNLIVVPPHYDQYQAFTKRIAELAGRFSPSVELCSIDEMSLDLNHLLVRDDADRTMRNVRQFLVSFKAALVHTVGAYVTASIGFAGSPTLAKIAADRHKPDGQFIITDHVAWARQALLHGLGGATWVGLRQQLNLDDIPGIGRKLAPTLRLAGYATIDDLAKADPGSLMLRFGVLGHWLSHVARGLHTNRPLTAFQQPAREQSMSHTTTLPRDLPLRLTRATFFVLAERVATRLRRADLVARQLFIGFGRTNAPNWYAKQRYTYPIKSGLALFRRGWHLVEQEWGSHAPFIRRPHVGVTELVPAESYPASLFALDRRGDRAIEVAHQLRQRWGSEAIQPATALTAQIDRVPDGRRVRYEQLATH